MRFTPANLWRTIAFAAFALFVAAPLTAIVGSTVFGDNGFDLAPWTQIFASAYDRHAMLRSLALGGCCALVAFAVGFGHAWLTVRTDMPAAAMLGPLAVLPLVIPPIFVAMAATDFDIEGLVASWILEAQWAIPIPAALLAEHVKTAFGAGGFYVCVLLLGVAYAPFVAILAGHGLRAVDGRAYESALLTRGRRGAEWFLFRSVWPELAAGLLLVFVFVLSEHGVPEYLTVKGKTWHTYAEAMFARWTRRATGVDQHELASPIVAAIPLVVVIGIALVLALRFRARGTVGTGFRGLPIRRLGTWRWPALVVPGFFLGFGVGLPLLVLTRWGMGSTQRKVPMSFELFAANTREAMDQIGDDLVHTVVAGALAVVATLAIALPLAWFAARRRGLVDALATIPIAVPAVLLGIGMVKVFNRDLFGTFYDGTGLLVAGYAARFLPFGVLTLSGAIRRITPELEEAATLTGRSQIARASAVLAPLLIPATWSAACLIFVLALRELDLAVVLPAGNDTVVRRLSNMVHFGGQNVGGPTALLLLGIAVFVPVLTVLLSGKRMKGLN